MILDKEENRRNNISKNLEKKRKNILKDHKK